MQEKQRSTLFNIMTSLFTKFFLLFGGFIVSVITARLLGPEGKGIITAVFVFPTLIISFADMGIRQSTAYFIGQNKYRLSEVISSIAFLWIITSLGSIIIVLIYYSIVMSNSYSWTILLIATSSIPLKLIEQYSRGILLGRNQISIINASEIIRLITNFSAVVLLVWIFDLGVVGAAIVNILISLSVAVYYMYYISKYGKFEFKPIGDIPKQLIFKGFSFAIALFIINLNYKVDIMILERMVNSSQVGIYSIGVIFSELLWQIPSAVGMVLFAKSASTKSHLSSVERSTRVLRIVLPIILIVSLFIALMAPLVIRIFYGVEFVGASNVLRILLPGVFFITISKILHPDLSARGYPLYALKIFSISLIINIVFNLILIPYYGIYGAGISTSISYMIAGLGYGYIYAKKEKIKIRDILFLNKGDIKFIKEQYRLLLKR